jgi:hypothetical protein
MNIENEIGAQNLAMVSQKSNSRAVTAPSNENDRLSKQSNNFVPKEMSLSTEGKLIQNIDKISDEVDEILIKHITPVQKKALEEIYTKLDVYFAKEKLTDKEGESTEALFEQVHVILETSLEKLSKSEHSNVDKLGNKMDTLTSQLERNEKGNIENSHSLLKAPGSQTDMEVSDSKGGKKSLTVAQLNALSVIELNKLPANQLKKLNNKQLNAAQLNNLDVAQLKRLKSSSVDKLNQSQANKLSTV